MKFKELYFHTAVIACCTAFLSSLAFAETYTVTGTVTDVETVYRTKTVTDPVQRCWTEEVPVYGNNGDKTGDALMGAIIGGVIGNNVTKDLPDGGTAGAIIGGILGHQNSKKGNEIVGYRTVNKCSTQYNERTEEYIAGYKIQYEALGLRGTTTSTRSTRVGSLINVTVNLQAQ